MERKSSLLLVREVDRHVAKADPQEALPGEHGYDRSLFLKAPPVSA